MKPLELVFKYLKIFYSEGDLGKLKTLLDENLSFTGPFYKLNSADDYVSSLKKDSPKGMKYEIIKSFEDKNSACVIYQFTKNNVSTLMSQMFEVENGKICKITLIFDGSVFK